MKFEEAIDFLKKQSPSFLAIDKSGKGYICPVCGSGSGNKGTGLREDPGKRGHYKCFACGKYGDIFDWIGAKENTDIFYDQFISACKYYNINYDQNLEREDFPQKEKISGIPGEKPTAEEKEEKSMKIDCDPFIEDAIENLNSDESGKKYLHERGLTDKTIKDMRLGLYTDSYGVKRICIPYKDNKYFVGRRIDTDEDYKYMKPGKVRAGRQPAFYIPKENTDNKIVFIVEGHFCAMSIVQEGGFAVATCGPVGLQHENYIRDNREQFNHVIISMDNDDAGQINSQRLKTMLDDLGISYTEANISGWYKDPNEALQTDREEFRDMLLRAELKFMPSVKMDELKIDNDTDAEPVLLPASYHNPVSAYLNSFINGIKESIDTKYIPTGFNELDNVLDGGIYEGLYFIGAISSLGKTTLLLQIADQIAKQSQDVIIFSLEMARSELISKSISRITLEEARKKKNTRLAKSARGITTGSKWAEYRPEEIKHIEESIDAYRKYSDHLYIHEGIGEIGVNEIRNIVESHIKFKGNKPVVIIDYLQILAPYNSRYSDKQNIDKAVLELKRLSRDHKIPVLGISSFNRDSYKGELSMSAFKESGSIEYSSDVLIGLQLQGAGSKDFNEQEAKQANPRQVELKILKNRNGQTGETIDFNYYPVFNRFEEI